MFSLEDYVALGIMTPDQAGALRDAVCARKNILVAGGTSTGKTTLTNALLGEVAKRLSVALSLKIRASFSAWRQTSWRSARSTA